MFSEATPQIEASSVEDTLKPIYREAAHSAVMLGAGENYISVAAISLQATAVQLGILSAIPQLFGGLAQIAGVWMGEIYGTRRQLLVQISRVQSIFWLFLAALIAELHPSVSATWWFIGCATLHYLCSGLMNPVQSSLLGDIIPTTQRGKTIGQRTRTLGAMTFFSMFLGGLLLHILESKQLAWVGFSVLFLLSGLSRLRSSHWFGQFHDPLMVVDPLQRFKFWQFVSRAPYSNFARFTFFVAAINFAVAFSAPFFALYMLRDLQLSYLEFTLVGASALVVQFLAVAYWGELSDRFGTKAILNVCSFGVSVIPFLWLLSSWVPYLMAIQVYSGFMWAGFQLAANTFMYDAVTPPKRARCVAYQSVIVGIFFAGGSLFGGSIADHIVPVINFFGLWTVTLSSPLLIIFLLSGLMRFITAIFFLRRFSEVREIHGGSSRALLYSITHLRPLSGATLELFSGVSRRWRKTSHQEPEEKLR